MKHAVAAGVVVGGVVVSAAGLYFALLTGAALAGEPLGGPLALLFLVLLAFVASVIAVGLLLLPTTALTEWICGRYRLPWLVQIPMATGLLGANVLALVLLVAVLWETPAGSPWLHATVVYLVLLVPLGAYWWTTQAVSWFIGMGVKSWRRMKDLRCLPE